MKTNNKEVRQAIKKHILDCVYDFEGNEFPDFDSAKNHLSNEFGRVANYSHNIRRIPNDQERFSDYLCGIPFNFEYMNCSIKEFLDSLGINPGGKEYTDEQSMKLYHYLIYKEIAK